MDTLTGVRPPSQQAGGGRRWRFPWAAFITALVALIGLLLFLYPGTASWWSQYNQSKVIREVSSAVSAEPGGDRQAELDRAHAYNDQLVSGAQLKAGANAPTSEGASSADAEYEGLLRGDAAGAMGRLRVPGIQLDLPIYHGTSDETLEKGVGHLKGTSLPVGGGSQHSVLTAHRGLASAELFSNLDRVRVGDRFSIEVFGEVLSYQVTDTRVVEPEDTETLFPVAGEDLVTLVTCTPLGINSHRILVTGERILPTPQADLDNAGKAPDIPGFPWWAVALGGALVGLGSYVAWAGRPPKPLAGSAPDV